MTPDPLALTAPAFVPGALVLAASAAYLALLFVIAAWADRRAEGGRSVIGNPWVYALSWAVYCTAWTYFGSVGRAAAGGIWFLPIYLGPMLAMTLAWLVLRKMVRIAQTYRITSIADFIASRYGKSPALAALVTLITVVGIVPYIALQVKAVSAGYEVLTGDTRAAIGPWWRDGTLAVTLALAGFTIIFGTRHLDLSERHEGMVAAVAFESLVKLAAFLAVGAFVTFGLFDGPADIWARAQAVPDLAQLMRLDGGAAGGAGDTARFGHAQWFAMTMLAMLSVLLLPRQFQMMVVECTDERHIRRAAWVFAAYLLAINVFVLPLAIGGMLLLGPSANPETFVLSLPLSEGARGLALVAYLGGLSAATGMLIVETVAVATMVCNDLVMPLLLRLGVVGRKGGGVTRLLLTIRRAAILVVLLLGYLYFRVAGDVYALVSIGLISFAAVAQFAPALLGGIFWRGGTAAGALSGLAGGFAVWAYTLMLPALAKSGWLGRGILTDGPWGIAWLAPERLFGLTELDYLTHALFWSMTVNVALYALVSLARAPSAREASQALLFVDVFDRGRDDAIFWRGRARTDDLRALAARLLGAARADQIMAGAVPGIADARLVDHVERQIGGAIGAASARVMVAAVVQEEPLALSDVIGIIDEASQIRLYARALEEKSASLEAATAELRAANEALKSLDQMKDDFMSSVTHELRTPLTSIRALSELMLDAPDMEDDQRAEFLRIVVSESQRLSRLVNQVLDMAKMEAGNADWAEDAVDMAALIREAVQATAGLFGDKGAAVAVDLAPVPVIRADHDRLMQVMVNLLSNAAKFVPDTGGRVQVSLTSGPDALVIRVTDNGRGIAAEDLAAVFDRFRQVGDRANRPPGTGLGLPISRRIVEHYGGEIWVESGTGQGASFAVRLPLDPGRRDTT